MACITHTRHILRRDGTNQLERLLDALKPGFVNVDERSREDLVKFIQSFSEQVQYYNGLNKRDGDWTDFFNDFNRDYEPHVALMLTFLELFRKAQDHINEMTRRHLEFYYKKILQVKERPAEPDRVHLIVELAKDIQQFKLDKGTPLKAGKDKTGRELLYKTEKEIVINRAKISDLKTIFVDRIPENRIYSAPMANAADGVSKPLKGDEPKWYSFGHSQSGLPADQQTMTEPEIGFAIASSVLRMNEGKRTITLSYKFNPVAVKGGINLAKIVNTNFTQSLKAWFSGEKKWIGPFDIAIDSAKDNKGLVLTILVGPENPAIVPYLKTLSGGTFDTSLPVLKIIIDKEKQPYPYQLLQYLRISSATLSVRVEGIQKLILQNEQGPVDPSKPFMPFGSQPAIGSSFYIGSEEVFSKKPDTLELVMKWKDLPQNAYGFDGYYSAYDSGKYQTDSFKCRVAALQDKKWTDEVKQESIKLFDLTGTGYVAPIYEVGTIEVTAPLISGRKKARGFKKASAEPVTFSTGMTEMEYGMGSAVSYISKLYTGEITRTIDVGKISLRHDPGISSIKQFDVSAVSGFLKLELLGQDFGHKEYPAVQVKKAMELSKFVMDTGTSDGGPELPNPPYTPVLDCLKLNYSSSQVLKPQSVTPDNGAIQVFHIEPFGVKEILNPAADNGIPLLPQFTDEGYLFIGIENLVPRQILSLLFQIAESSSLTETFVKPEELNWCYLSNNEWIAFKSPELLSDSTKGLQTSGIIEFDVPETADKTNCVMPSGMHWIRVSVPDYATGANQMINITAQAITAVFTDQGNDPEHLEEVLAAGSISKLAISKPSVKKIIQPYASFGGRMAEGKDPFYGPYYTRVSERLRHKERAITIWDMEHMVLEQFPGIYKVKCLNHSSDTTDIAPGHITMVVVENIRNKNAVNPLEPKTSSINLYNIGKFLEKYVTPFVTVHVQNPLYEQILVDFKVYFHPGFDTGFYKQQLNEEIKKFLSPWAYLEGEDIVFGNIIYKSSILNFIEEREYVDYVVDFKMYHIMESWGIGCMEILNDFVVGDKDVVIDEDQAEAKTSRSILVSAPNHAIYVLGENEYACEGIAT